MTQPLANNFMGNDSDENEKSQLISSRSNSYVEESKSIT